MFVQRQGSALRLNVHARTLVLDGGCVWADEKLVIHKRGGGDGDSVTQEDALWRRVALSQSTLPAKKRTGATCDVRKAHGGSRNCARNWLVPVTNGT